MAGGNGRGNTINQLFGPHGCYVDAEQTVSVAEISNRRISEWKSGAMNSQRTQCYDLIKPTDVIVDKNTDRFIICDAGHKSVIRCSRRNGTRKETIISSIDCLGLTIDEVGSLYITNPVKHEVRRYRRGESQGAVVAGGNGQGDRLDQLSTPAYVCVDRDHSVYVSEYENHRVTKWLEGAKQGIVVAGGQGEGDSLSHLSSPLGVVVDQLDTLYVADHGNCRIMRWPKEATEGSVIVGGNGRGAESNQLRKPTGLSFDGHGNLYVADCDNYRVIKFNIASNS